MFYKIYRFYKRYNIIKLWSSQVLCDERKQWWIGKEINEKKKMDRNIQYLGSKFSLESKKRIRIYEVISETIFK